MRQWVIPINKTNQNALRLLVFMVSKNGIQEQRARDDNPGIKDQEKVWEDHYNEVMQGKSFSIQIFRKGISKRPAWFGGEKEIPALNLPEAKNRQEDRAVRRAAFLIHAEITEILSWSHRNFHNVHRDRALERGRGESVKTHGEKEIHFLCKIPNDKRKVFEGRTERGGVKGREEKRGRSVTIGYSE